MSIEEIYRETKEWENRYRSINGIFTKKLDRSQMFLDYI